MKRRNLILGIVGGILTGITVVLVAVNFILRRLRR